MIDAASGGGKPTNKERNEIGGSNEGNNKNSNGRRPDRSGNQYSTSKFKGKVEGLSTLVVK